MVVSAFIIRLTYGTKKKKENKTTSKRTEDEIRSILSAMNDEIKNEYKSTGYTHTKK